jgi:hypothetical protein
MLNFNEEFHQVLYFILLIKAVVGVLFFIWRNDFISYSALFYEDGYFNPFIVEKNVIDFEEEQ